MKSVITVKNLVKRYKKSDKAAVDDISFDVQNGEFFSFLGPNGAGKTTTISILTTLLSKTSGEVTIAGYDVETQETQVRQQVGIIFQKPSLDLKLTGEENIRFHATLYNKYPFRPLYRLMPKAYKQEVNKLSQILGVEGELFNTVETFSGGMKRKFEIVRSLIHEPKILFLDEPTSGLDPESRKNLWSYLQKIRETRNVTIFLTTHYLEEAEGADQICVINHGKIVANGSPSAIKKKLIDEYILIDTTQRDKLKAELEAKNILFSSSGPFKIPLKKHTAQQIIKMVNTKLTRLSIHTPTLEEAYLEIINKSNNETKKRA